MSTTKNAYASQDNFDRLMGDMQVLYTLRAGQTVTQEQVDALNRLDAHYREEDERATDAYSRGFKDGMTHGGGADVAAMQERLDREHTDLAVERALRRVDRLTCFLQGARACREMMARFVEQGGDEATAASIRANWHPEWGTDPGQPDNVLTLAEVLAPLPKEAEGAA